MLTAGSNLATKLFTQIGSEQYDGLNENNWTQIVLTDKQQYLYLYPNSQDAVRKAGLVAFTQSGIGYGVEINVDTKWLEGFELQTTDGVKFYEFPKHRLDELAQQTEGPILPFHIVSQDDRIRPVVYEVGDPNPDGISIPITIESRAPNKWCVRDGFYCYDEHLNSHHEPNPSNRTDDFINATRFGFEQAEEIAKQVLEKKRAEAIKVMRFRINKDHERTNPPV